MSKLITPTIGLYRHFKGDYYFVQNIVKDCTNGKLYCQYFNVCNPELGTFVRLVEDFITDHDTTEQFGDEMTIYIKDRKDNVTGQHYRFEKVHNLNFQLGSIPTEQLLEEMFKREDCPLTALDLDMFESKVDCKDYVVGYNIGDYVETLNFFDTEEQAKIYLATHRVNPDTHLYKRTFIRIK